MEDELRRYYDSADENNQIIEGVITAVPLTRRNRTLDAISIRMQARPSTLFSYKIADSGFIYGEHVHGVSSSLLDAWIYQLSQDGINTYYTENSIRTAKLLATIYNNCQKPPEEHTTLQRYYRPRIVIKEQSPFIKALMFISVAYKIGIGEDKAGAIAARYSSLLDIAMSSIDELREIEGIGKIIAEKLFSAICWKPKEK